MWREGGVIGVEGITTRETMLVTRQSSSLDKGRKERWIARKGNYVTNVE